MLHYDIAPQVDAFTTGIGEELPYYVVQPHQVHLDRVGIVTDAKMIQDDFPDTDALITNVPGCAIGVRTADCVPILLYDPVHRAVAAIHDGWRGTVQHLSQKTIAMMTEQYGTLAADLLAVIGPSISPEAFEVGEEVVEQFAAAGFPDVIVHRNMGPKPHIDLWKANQWLLTTAGVKPEQIQVSGVCTYQHHDIYYSARKDDNRKGFRNINAIKLL